MIPVNSAINPSTTIQEVTPPTPKRIKQRAFLSNPLANSFTASPLLDLKECNFKIAHDYRDDIQKIRNNILQSNEEHKNLFKEQVRTDVINSHITGVIHQTPFEFLLNYLGIYSIEAAIPAV